MVRKKTIHYFCEGGIEISVLQDHRQVSDAKRWSYASGGFFYPAFTLMIDSYKIALCVACYLTSES